MKYFESITSALSQLCHGIFALSNPDISMSAKTGWKAIEGSWWFVFIQHIIDSTFWFIEGPEHCKRAYMRDQLEQYELGDHLWSMIAISIIQLAFCAILIIPFIIFHIIIKIYESNRTKKEKSQHHQDIQRYRD